MYAYIYIYIYIYISVYIYHINPRIIIEYSPHGKMWAVKHVYRTNQKQDFGEWGGKLSILS